MLSLTDFLDRCDALAARMGVARSTLSRQLMPSWETLDRLRDGSMTVTLATYERALSTLEALERQHEQAA